MLFVTWLFHLAGTSSCHLDGVHLLLNLFLCKAFPIPSPARSPGCSGPIFHGIAAVASVSAWLQVLKSQDCDPGQCVGRRWVWEPCWLRVSLSSPTFSLLALGKKNKPPEPQSSHVWTVVETNDHKQPEGCVLWAHKQALFSFSLCGAPSLAKGEKEAE